MNNTVYDALIDWNMIGLCSLNDLNMFHKMFEDLDSLSRQLKIKKNVLVRLKEISGPKFSNFSNIKSQELFWDAVDDNLSFSESNELHKMELEFATSSNSFDSSFLNASFQDLFLYNCKLNERVPSSCGVTIQDFMIHLPFPLISFCPSFL